MNKVNGTQASFAPIREDGSRITICYGLNKVKGDLYEWYEIYLSKKQLSQLTFADVKAAIIADINERVKNTIISGFRWNGKPVWLSEENQLNFNQAVVPVTFKIGEEDDGTPIYQEFEDNGELYNFCCACTSWKQECLAAGYTEKDSIDWTPYEAQFPKDDK